MTRHLSDRLYWVSAVAAVMPIAVAAVRGCIQGWAPVSDNGFVAVRSFDVLTGHPPLLGLWSSASAWSGVQFNLPGPLEFELLAVPVHLLGQRVGTAIGMAMVNAAAVVVTAMLARRRGGSSLAVGAMLFVVSLEWSMGSELLYDPWPINSAPLIFVLFLFAAWSVADGDLLAVPALAFSASYLVQTHLSYVILVPAVGVVSGLGLTSFLRSRQRQDPDQWSTLRLRAVVGLAASAVFTLLLWAPPIYQQFAGSPGNVTQMAKALRAKPPHPPDARAAIRIVGATVALPPLWLPPSYRSPRFSLDGKGRALPVASAAIALLAAAGAALGGLALRRRDRTSAALLAVAGGALLAGLATTYKSPAPYGYDPNYLRWLWPTSMFCWFSIAAAAIRLTTRPQPSQQPRRSALALTVVVLGLTILSVPKVDNGVFSQIAGPIADDLAKRALPQLRGSSPVLVQLSPGGLSGNVAPMILVILQRHGTDFVVDTEPLVHQLGDARRWNGQNAMLTLRVDPSPAPARGFRRIATHTGLSKSEQRELVRLNTEVERWLTASGGPRISPIGRRLVAGEEGSSRFFRTVVAHLRSVRRDPNSLMADEIFSQILGTTFSDHGMRSLFFRTDPLGDGKVRRWAQLTTRSRTERVSIDLATAGQQ